MLRGPCSPQKKPSNKLSCSIHNLAAWGQVRMQLLLLAGGSIAQMFQRTLCRKSPIYLSRKEPCLPASTFSCFESMFWSNTVLRQPCLPESILGKMVNSMELTRYVSHEQQRERWMISLVETPGKGLHWSLVRHHLNPI